MDRAQHKVKHAQLIKTKALPDGAATVNGDGIDLELLTKRGAFLAECELEIAGPLLTTTELPDTKTMKYDVQCDADVEFGSPKTLAKEVLVQTGAGGAGAAAATARFRIPSDCEQYLRVTATNDGAGDCTGKDMTNSILF